MEIREYLIYEFLMWSSKLSTKKTIRRIFPDEVVWVGLGLGLGLVSKLVFGAVFDIFRLIILETQVGQTKFPDFYTLY